MSQEDVNLVLSVVAPGADVGEGSARLVMDEELWESGRDRIDPGVRVHFVIPGGGVRVMEQDEFEGVEGLKAGWRTWMEPWEEFRVAFEDAIDAGDGGVLVLGAATGTMQGSGTEVPQEVAALCRVEGGRITTIRFYLDQAQARREAGLT